MRDDFGILILTHGRADRVLTVRGILQNGHYTGKWYLVLDDEDEQRSEYIKRYGAERVVVFSKSEVAEWTDTADNFNEHRAIVYARNKSFSIAKDLGLKYFLMLDDDFSGIDFRYIEGKSLKAKRVKNFDRLCEGMIQFLEDSDALTVAFCQAGDFVGGVDGKRFSQKCIRKAMNSFFCKTDRPFHFVGTMNEDVTMYTTLGSRGARIFSITDAAIIQAPTQSMAGGMSQIYKDSGTYVKSFYSVMAMPSAVKVGMMNSTHRRIHHNVNWKCCVPKILDEKYRRFADEI